jgi:hypothetical protein
MSWQPQDEGGAFSLEEFEERVGLRRLQTQRQQQYGQQQPLLQPQSANSQRPIAAPRTKSKARIASNDPSHAWFQRAVYLRRELQDDEPSPEELARAEQENQGKIHDEAPIAKSKQKGKQRAKTTPPPQRLPKHAQMKVKTNEMVVSVRKTDLLITFHQVRVIADDGKVHAAPTSKMQLDVRPVAMHADAFHPGTTGVFVPMKTGSALRVCFETRMKHGRNPYLIRIYSGKTNVISGRKDDFVKKGKTSTALQDYIVVPDQKQIDGFSLSTEKARQFTAPTDGPGWSFGWPCERGSPKEPRFANLRFEITPFEFQHPKDYFIRANGWMARKMMLPIKEGEPVQIPRRIEEHYGILADVVRWKYRGRTWPDG